MIIERVIALLGPVSLASPNGGGPSWNTIGILIPGWLLVTAWRKYLKREPALRGPMADLIWGTVIAALIIAVSIWEFAH